MTDARKFLANARKSVGQFLAKEEKKKDASDSDDDGSHSGSGHSSTNANLKDSTDGKTEFKDGYYEGWLTKKGKIRRNWKKRWFTLENGLLNYYSKDYKVKEGAKAKATGSIKINGCIFGPTSLIGRKYSNSFQLITQNRTFFFFTETQPEFQMWKEKLIKNGAKWDEKITRLSLITDDDSDDSEDSKSEPLSSQQSGNTTAKMNQNLFELFTTFRQRGQTKQLGDIRDLVSVKQATKLEKLKQSPPEVVSLFWTFFDYPPLHQLQITSQTQDTANSNSATLILKYQPTPTDNNNSEDLSTLIGTIQFVKEDSHWKIHHEVWEDE